MKKAYEHGRGAIEVTDASRGDMRCRCCGQTWTASVRPDCGGKYYRSAWTCPTCGANTKTKAPA